MSSRLLPFYFSLLQTILTKFTEYLNKVLVEIQDKIVSTEVFEKKFVCDLNACKGACCVEGDTGAPLTVEEIGIIEDNYEKIKPYMRKEGKVAVELEGVFYMDKGNEPVTTLVDEKECAFVYFDEQNIAKWAIEKANREGKIDFKKPISCHLYPIRLSKLKEYTVLNYDVWKICQPACECGTNLDVSVYKFLREPLIRAFGDEFYKELELVDVELKKNNL